MNAFYTLIGLFVAHFGVAQCNLSLHNTFIICDYNNLPLSLESGLQISGGTEPYSFYWNCFWELLPGSPINMDEHDILDDPTSSHPTIINSVPGDTLELFLTVTDAELNACEASILVITSCFNITLGAACESAAISSGGSIELCTETSACIEPATYSWTPSASLDNPSSSNPVASPAESTLYTCTITDALGCTATSQMNVGVQTTDITNEQRSSFTVFWNPLQDVLNIQLPYSNIWGIKVYSIHGILVKEEKSSQPAHHSLNVNELSSGIYTLVCQDELGKLFSQKIVKQ